ncbi:MAG: superinfection immunity protein, partial [Elusimicrobiota bacterium]
KNNKKTIETIIINIFLGWTVIGWIIALIMAISGEVKETKRSKYGISILLAFIVLISSGFIALYFEFKDAFASTLVNSQKIQSTISVKSKPKISDIFDIDIIKYEAHSNEMTTIKIKIKNISEKKIKRCYLTCVLYKNRKEVDAMSHYAVKSSEGGLSPGEYTYFSYTLSTGRNEFDSVKFNIKNIDYY